MSIDLRCFEMMGGEIVPHNLIVNSKENNLIVCENWFDVFKYKDYFNTNCPERSSGCSMELAIPTINDTISVYLHKRSSCGIIEFLDETTDVKYLYKIPVIEIANSLIKRILNFGLDAANATARDILYECFTEICHVKCPMATLSYKEYGIDVKNASINLQAIIPNSTSNIIINNNHSNEVCISNEYLFICMFGLMTLGAVMFYVTNFLITFVKRKCKVRHQRRLEMIRFENDRHSRYSPRNTPASFGFNLQEPSFEDMLADDTQEI
jgi:hypothetical protein